MVGSPRTRRDRGASDSESTNRSAAAAAVAQRSGERRQDGWRRGLAWVLLTLVGGCGGSISTTARGPDAGHGDGGAVADGPSPNLDAPPGDGGDGAVTDGQLPNPDAPADDGGGDASGPVADAATPGDGSASDAHPPFPVYYEPVVLGDLGAYGFSAIEVVYSADSWANSESATMALAATLPSDRPVVLDVEIWAAGHIDSVNGYCVYPNGDSPTLATNIERWIQIADWMHAGNPALKLGYYGILPVNNPTIFHRYFYALDHGGASTCVAWEHDQMLHNNVQLQPLASHVDYVFPDLYTFSTEAVDGGPPYWRAVAQEALAEARQYNRPVFPFIWPQLDYGSWSGAPADLTTWPYLDQTQWQLELDLMHELADGVVIWLPAGSTFDPNGAWETTTIAFIQTL